MWWESGEEAFPVTDRETLPTAQELWPTATMTPEQQRPDSTMGCWGQLPPGVFICNSSVGWRVCTKVWQLLRKGSVSKPPGTMRTCLLRRSLEREKSWSILRGNDSRHGPAAGFIPVARRQGRALGKMLQVHLPTLFRYSLLSRKCSICNKRHTGDF